MVFKKKKIIQKLCPDSPVNLTNLNGKDVAIDAIAKRLQSLINILNNRYYPIVIIIDREKREQSYSDIKCELEQEIKKYGINDILHIGVPDRMIENWILADWISFCSNINVNKNKTKPSYEGLSGKGQIKKLYPSYHETTNGVKLFLDSNPKAIYENSPSFKNFIDSISNINCHWYLTNFTSNNAAQT